MAEPTAKRKRAAFRFYAPDATRVSIAGSFNDWSVTKHLMKRDGDGTWGANLLLFPGTYEYRLFVDGCWVDDPGAAAHVPNEFGTTNGICKIVQ